MRKKALSTPISTGMSTAVAPLEGIMNDSIASHCGSERLYVRSTKYHEPAVPESESESRESPDALSVVYVVMLFFANILGELIELYLSVSLWDAALHLVAGFFLALTGCSFVEIMSEKKPRPLLAFLFALTFSVFISLLWEFFEYFMDCVFRYDMQKDTLVSHVSSILLDPNGTNTSVTEEIKSVVVNGAVWPGYIDIGLHDTMSDMLIAAAGALIAAICCLINARSPKRFRFIRAFYMKKKQ